MDLFAFNSAVGILHNCARNPDIDKDIFRNLKLTELLHPFLKSTVCKYISKTFFGNYYVNCFEDFLFFSHSRF